MSKPLSLYEQATEDYREATLDYLWTLQERMEKNGTTGPRKDALVAELKRRMESAPE